MKGIVSVALAGLLLAGCQTAGMAPQASAPRVTGPQVTIAASDPAIKRAIREAVADRGYGVVEDSGDRYVLQRSADPRLVATVVPDSRDPNPQVRLTYSLADVSGGTRVTLTPAIVTGVGSPRQRIIPTPTHTDAARLQRELDAIKRRAEI